MTNSTSREIVIRPSWAHNQPPTYFGAGISPLDFTPHHHPQKALEIAWIFPPKGDVQRPMALQDSVLVIARYDLEQSRLWMAVRTMKHRTEEVKYMSFEEYMHSEWANNQLLSVREAFKVDGKLEEETIVKAWLTMFPQKKTLEKEQSN